MRVRVAIAAAALAAAAGPAAGIAHGQAPSVRHMKLAIEVTGIQVIDWHHLSAADPDPQELWKRGKGRQILGFSTRRPLRFIGIAQRGKVAGRALQRLALVAARPVAPARGSLRRELEGWQELHPPPPCEGDCDESETPIQVNPLFNCDRLRPRVPLALDVVPARGLRVRFEPPAHPWELCPPDHPGGGGQLRSHAPQNIFFAGAGRRLSKLRPGRKVTLRSEAEAFFGDGAEADRCPPDGEGFQECSLTEVTIEVRRLR